MWRIDGSIPLSVRRWIYGVAMAVLPLLIAYGVVDEKSAPLWAALVGAALVPGLSLAATVPDDRPVHLGVDAADIDGVEDDGDEVALVDGAEIDHVPAHAAEVIPDGEGIATN